MKDNHRKLKNCEIISHETFPCFLLVCAATLSFVSILSDIYKYNDVVFTQRNCQQREEKKSKKKLFSS